MAKEFSKAWKSSTNPGKQRKYIFNAPQHIKSKFLSSNLSKALREEFNKRSARVRIGDTVKIMRGENRGKTGEITSVSIKDTTVHVKGIVRKKVNGQEASIPLKPSNLQIIEIDTKDEKRLKTLKKNLAEKTTKTPAKEPKKVTKK